MRIERAKKPLYHAESLIKVHERKVTPTPEVRSCALDVNDGPLNPSHAKYTPTPLKKIKGYEVRDNLDVKA